MMAMNLKEQVLSRPILYAKSTDGLIFRNNTVTYNNEFEPFHWNKYLFFFEKVDNVTIEGNNFERELTPSDDIRTELSAPDAVTVKQDLIIDT